MTIKDEYYHKAMGEKSYAISVVSSLTDRHLNDTNPSGSCIDNSKVPDSMRYLRGGADAAYLSRIAKSRLISMLQDRHQQSPYDTYLAILTNR